MSFDTTLREIFSGCPDVSGVAFMGTDGIPIAQWDAELPDAGEAQLDVVTLGVEIGRVLDETRKTADSLGAGTPVELAVRMARVWVLMRVIDAETQLVVVLDGDGNVGRARFAMRRSAAVLRELL